MFMGEARSHPRVEHLKGWGVGGGVRLQNQVAVGDVFADTNLVNYAGVNGPYGSFAR
jgi:hypothetical protein